MTDIQTGGQINQIMVKGRIRIAYSTGPMTTTCNGMTSNVTTTKDSFASKYSFTVLRILVRASTHILAYMAQ